MKIRKIWLALFLAAMFLIPASPSVVVQAAGKTGSVTLTKAIPNTEYRLYQVSKRTDDGTFAVTEKMKPYDKEGKGSIDLSPETSSEMRDTAVTLAGSLETDNVKADAVQKAVVDAASKEEVTNGTVTFEKLVPGLYLILGESYTAEDGTIYEQSPVLTYIPAADAKGNEVYDVTVELKHETETQTTEYSVVKVWKDSDNKYRKRPVGITVILYRKEGSKYVEYDRVTLSKDNNWKKVWKKLPAGTYRVKEVDVKDYKTVITTRKSEGTVITNSYTPPKPPTPYIPQTGQLWWPVALFASLGVLFVGIGLLRRRG